MLSQKRPSCGNSRAWVPLAHCSVGMKKTESVARCSRYLHIAARRCSMSAVLPTKSGLGAAHSIFHSDNGQTAARQLEYPIADVKECKGISLIFSLRCSHQNQFRKSINLCKHWRLFNLGRSCFDNQNLRQADQIIFGHRAVSLSPKLQPHTVPHEPSAACFKLANDTHSAVFFKP